MKYADLGDLPEDTRITMIGKALMHAEGVDGHPPQVAFVVEDVEKATRYVNKLTEQFPGIDMKDLLPGPVPDTVSVIMWRKPS